MHSYTVGRKYYLIIHPFSFLFGKYPACISIYWHVEPVDGVHSANPLHARRGRWGARETLRKTIFTRINFYEKKKVVRLVGQIMCVSWRHLELFLVVQMFHFSSEQLLQLQNQTLKTSVSWMTKNRHIWRTILCTLWQGSQTRTFFFFCHISTKTIWGNLKSCFWWMRGPNMQENVQYLSMSVWTGPTLPPRWSCQPFTLQV